jgi:DNA-nicking Smr family endonuclease
MDFGDVLETWEKKNNKYPDKDKDITPESGEKIFTGIKKLKKMQVQAVLDLHGLTSAEAEKSLWKFLADSKAKGLIKVQIIHGKGLHSPEGSVLSGIVDNVLRECPYAGITGLCDNKNGGSGSRWVILK